MTTCPRCQAECPDHRTFCPNGHRLPALDSIQLSPQATPSKPRKASKVPAQSKNSWERGTAVEQRPGGFAMPYIRPDGSHIGVKDWGQKERRKFQEAGLA